MLRIIIKKYFQNNISSQIFLTFLSKFIAFLCMYLTVPLLVKGIDSTRYGIWLLIFSIIQWMVLFDFGLSNGIRNNITRARALANHSETKKYISLAYASYFFIAIILFFIGILVIPSIAWYKVFNSPEILESEIRSAVTLIFFMQAVKFCFDSITMVLYAFKKPGISNLISSVSSLLCLGLTFLFIKIGLKSLYFIALASMLPHIIVLTIANCFFFSKKFFPLYRPDRRSVEFKMLLSVLKTSWFFFVMQVVYIIIFSTDSIIISKLYSPQDVVPYNTSFRYFSIVTIAFSIIVSPYWAEFAHYYSVNDISWIRSRMKRLRLIWLFFSGLTLVMVVTANYVYALWVGDSIVISTQTSIGMGIFVVLYNWNALHSNFLNGVSKIKIQYYASLIVGILNIPICLLVCRYTNLGPSGVIYGSSLCMLINVMLQPLQYKKIVANTATGIWNK